VATRPCNHQPARHISAGARRHVLPAILPAILLWICQDPSRISSSYLESSYSRPPFGSEQGTGGVDASHQAVHSLSRSGTGSPGARHPGAEPSNSLIATDAAISGACWKPANIFRRNSPTPKIVLIGRGPDRGWARLPTAAVKIGPLPSQFDVPRTRRNVARHYRVGTISSEPRNPSPPPASVRSPRSKVANTPFRRCARASR
jgi:hypothetical protein